MTTKTKHNKDKKELSIKQKIAFIFGGLAVLVTVILIFAASITNKPGDSTSQSSLSPEDAELEIASRNSARRAYLSELRTQIVQYQSNNRGRVPASLDGWRAMFKDYMNSVFTEQDGSTSYYYIAENCDMGVTEGEGKCRDGLADGSSLSWEMDKNAIYTFNKARCDGAKVIFGGENSGRMVAFITVLEGDELYCGEN